ncbi:MAG TPA: glycerophosphodiester phosphodiesterase family protein, partial [Polyangiaceae bacterium]|nr:glycerophosphodiester phosphodiesterase family protein [Polyangiaceae bacterium]
MVRFRSLILVSSFVALAAFAGCSSEGDDTAASGGSSGNAGSAGKGSAGEAGEPSAAGASTTTPTGSAGEGGAAGEGNVTPFLTLDGTEPLIIGHRGLPGLHPEETEVSYDAAADAGADSLEEDLHLSKDCVLVARHNPWLSDNTNIATVATTNASFMARKRTKPGELIDVTYDYTTVGGPAAYLSDSHDPLHELVVDGEEHVNDWSITDFTVDELKMLGGTTYDDAAERPKAENGLYPILTMQEIFDIRTAKAKSTGRVISVYPESKNPYWNNEQAKANGCGTGDHPFEDAIVKLITDNKMNTADSPIFVQSFDPESLKYMRSIGLATKVVQLIDADDYDKKTGDMIYVSDDVYNFID